MRTVNSRLPSKRGVITTACLSFVLGSIVVAAWAQLAPNDAKLQRVAILVYDRPVYESDVNVPLAAAEKRVESELGHRPLAPSEQQRVREVRDRMIREKIHDSLRALLRQELLDKYKITVSAKEVQDYWAVLTQGLDEERVRKDKSELDDEYGAILRVLVEVYENGKDPEEVYQTQLRGRIGRSAWDLYLQEFTEPEKREQLRAIMRWCPSDVETPDPSIFDLIATEKLAGIIDREIAESDPQYASFLDLETGRSGRPDSKEFPPNFRRIKHDEWWQQAMREADVEVLMPEYEKIVNELRPSRADTQ